MTKSVTIRNENDAFRLLKSYVDGAFDKDDVILEGWPKLTIRLNGKKFDQSLTIPVMKGLIELQSSLNRSYALSQYGVANGNKLSDEERKQLEIQVKVGKGSTLLEIDFQQIIADTLTKAVTQMDPKTIAVTIVALGVVWASRSAFVSFLDYRKEIKREEAKTEAEQIRLESMKFMSAEETKRAAIIASIVKDNVEIKNALAFADSARNELLKSISTADSAEVEGFKISSSTASELMTNARRKSEEIRLDGNYRILRNDTTDITAFKVKVRNEKTLEEFEAAVQDITLTNGTKLILQRAEWNRSLVRLKINAKSLDGDIRDAIVVGISEIKSPQKS